MYASQYKGAILGNAWTSSAFLDANPQSYSVFNCPSVICVWDWMSPTAKMMGIRFDEGPSVASRTNRALYLTSYPAFKCPENDVIATPFGGDISVNTQLVSYVTTAYFQCKSNKGQSAPSSEANADFAFVKYKGYSVTEGNYTPYIQKVGVTALKIYMTDGASWSTGSAPTSDFYWDASDSVTPFSYFTDPGPWDGFTRSFLPGVPRVYAFRHGELRPAPFTGAGSTISALKGYRFNAAFFDGHVETLDAYQAIASPVYWVPKGTSFPDSSEFSQEALGGIVSIPANYSVNQ